MKKITEFFFINGACNISTQIFMLWDFFFSTTEIINLIIKYTNLHTLKNMVKVQDQIHLNATSKHEYSSLDSLCLSGSIDPSMKQAVTKVASNKNVAI